MRLVQCRDNSNTHDVMVYLLLSLHGLWPLQLTESNMGWYTNLSYWGKLRSMDFVWGQWPGGIGCKTLPSTRFHCGEVDFGIQVKHLHLVPYLSLQREISVFSVVLRVESFYVFQCVIFLILGIKLRTLYLLDRHSFHWAIPPVPNVSFLLLWQNQVLWLSWFFFLALENTLMN